MYATVFVFFFSDYYFLLSSTELPSTILWYDFSRLWCHLLSPPSHFLCSTYLFSCLVLSCLLYLSLFFFFFNFSYLFDFFSLFIPIFCLFPFISFSARQWQKLYQVVGNWGTFFKKQWKRAWRLQRREINHPDYRFLFRSFLFLIICLIFGSFL